MASPARGRAWPATRWQDVYKRQVKDGVTRMLPVGTPAITTVDRVVEMVPQVMDRVESFIDKKREKADF